MTNWTDIHEDFGKYDYQQHWEQVNITKKKAKEWIEAGFEPSECWKVKKWKNFNFSPTETKTWLEVGLYKHKGDFAFWLRTKHYTPELVKNNLEQLRNDYWCGLCDKCQKTNTSYKWCQPCAEKEWQGLEGQELINRFIKQQKERETKEYRQLKWIPYKDFTDIEHIADGGFSKIYKAKWGRDYVVLKSLTNSQNITPEFLTEIANTKLVDGGGDIDNIVYCRGISQDPITKNYLMVMQYMEGGNLRQYLQNKGDEFSLEDKLKKLLNITKGLKKIHQQNLVHRDFHSGNILNNYSYSYIADLGLSRPVNHQKQTGEIFGVLPYMAPEVLRGQPYTKKADIYSWGIIAYELFANSYPYPKMDDLELTLGVCQGLRPNLDKVPIPQEIKDLIKNCWDNNPDKRPKAEELCDIIYNWEREVGEQQYLEIVAEYDTFSKKPYQIHGNATLTSKMIDTKQITQQLEKLKTTEYSKSLVMDFGGLNLESNSNWTNIHSSFTEELIQSWTNHNFTYSQTQEWINTGLQPTDYNFCAWLRDNKNYTSEQVLNHYNLEQLNQEFFTYWQEQQLQIQIEIPPKS